MYVSFNSHINLFLIVTLLILNACQLQEPHKNHGIIFLKNRSDKLLVNNTNKNDVLNILGQPHSRSIDDSDEWLYIERILTKGAYHRLGQNLLKTNNVLVLKFNRYGILTNKKLLNKDNKQKVAFSKNETENILTEKSFVEKFLQSVKTKMYSNRK